VAVQVAVQTTLGGSNDLECALQILSECIVHVLCLNLDELRCVGQETHQELSGNLRELPATSRELPGNPRGV
jgi:hypothetical protein